jgi:small subunit ribosomal protein S3
MGQKVNPCGIRLGFSKEWQNVQFLQTVSQLNNINRLRDYLKSVLKSQNILVGNIECFESKNIIHVVAVISYINFKQKHFDFRLLEKKLNDLSSNQKIILHTVETNNFYYCAEMLAQHCAFLLEKRRSYRDIFKLCSQIYELNQIKGIKISCAGRLDGAEIARTEWVKYGSLSLQVFKKKIDYAKTTAYTIYGTYGIKVWICR